MRRRHDASSSAELITIHVRLTPRGGRDAVDGWARDGEGRVYLKVRVASPPVDGAANEALVATLTRALKPLRAGVRIVSGDHSRLKQIAIENVSLADLHDRFGTPPEASKEPQSR